MPEKLPHNYIRIYLKPFRDNYQVSKHILDEAMLGPLGLCSRPIHLGQQFGLLALLKSPLGTGPSEGHMWPHRVHQDPGRLEGVVPEDLRTLSWFVRPGLRAKPG